jgi:hypothetical protein
MRLEKRIDGLWEAFGRGPLRLILVEAASRREALRAFVGMWMEQAEQVDQWN